MAVLIGGIFLTEAVAQTGRRIATPGDVWVVAYTLTIKGEGIKEPEIGGGGDVIIWKVDRTFAGSGTLKLLTSTPANLEEFTKYARERRGSTELFNEFRVGSERHLFHGKLTPTIRINDSILIKGDELCDEYGVTDETWKLVVDSTKDTGQGATLEVNNPNESHTMYIDANYIPLTLGTVSTGDPGVPIGVPLIYQRTITSYPAKKVNVEKPVLQRDAINLRIPKHEGWVQGSSGMVVRKNINLKGTGPYTFESGEIIVNETVLKGVDTSGNVKMKVTYVIRKVG